MRLRCFLVRSSVRKERGEGFNTDFMEKLLEDELRSAGCSDSTLKSATARSSVAEIRNSLTRRRGADHVLQRVRGTWA